MRIRRLVPALLLASLGGVTAMPGVAAEPVTPTLVAIRAAHHPGFDRVVFEFTGGLPASRRVRYVDELLGDASALPVPVAGQAILRVRFQSAQAHDDAGATAPARTAFALPNVLTAVQAGDFEGVTTYGVGLAKRIRFRVFTLHRPSRVVIDIRATFRTVGRKVWFLDRDNFVANRRPFFTAVQRPVRAATPAAGVMDRLFAGPVPAERQDGLRLLRSHATGYTDLSVDNGVARVRLTGGCASDGSTVTVADEIIPTLRRLRSVDWVKVYDPAGTTEEPHGRSDSIPDCLQP